MKKYAEMELERELTDHILLHKYSVIFATLMKQDKLGIDLFQQHIFSDFTDVEGTTFERAKTVAKTLVERYVMSDGEDKQIDKAYEVCWAIFVEIAGDNTNLRSGVRL